MNVPGAPEEAIERLQRRLTFHALWHSALLFLPPLLAAWYIVFFLYRFAWLSPDAVMISGALSLVAAAALTVTRFRTRAPSPATAARLLDEKSAAEERFVTLATLGPSIGPAEFISRLKSEAAALARRIDLKRDFPFRVERSILNSLIAALTALFVFQLVFQAIPPWPSDAPAKLAARANQLAREPRFGDLAAEMSALAEKLDAAGITANEKQAMISQVVEKLDRRIAIEGAEGRDVSVLQDTADEMREEVKRFDENSGLKLPFNIKQAGDQSGSGEGKGSSGQGEGTGAQKLEQKNGDGNATGERKSEKQGGAKTKDGQQRNAGSEAIQGKQGSSENRPEAQTKQGRELKNEGEREGQKTSPDNKAAAENGESKGRAGAKGEFKSDQAAGESKSEEKTPVRFGEKPSGELKEKDLRYVIVQLPDEGGGASGSRDTAGKKSAGALPSANVPLAPADEPRAAGEKQMLPLEYRGMIR